VYVDVMERMQTTLGEDHILTLTTMGYYANLLSDQDASDDDSAGARPWMQNAVDGMIKLLGERHPDTLLARRSLAELLGGLDEVEAAQTERNAVLAGRVVNLGADHADALHSKWELAEHLRDFVGDLDGAIALMTECVAGAMRNPDMGKPLENTQEYVKGLADENALLAKVETGLVIHHKSPWWKYINGGRVYYWEQNTEVYSLLELAEGVRIEVDQDEEGFEEAWQEREEWAARTAEEWQELWERNNETDYENESDGEWETESDEEAAAEAAEAAA